eukprot:UN29998
MSQEQLQNYQSKIKKLESELREVKLSVDEDKTRKYMDTIRQLKTDKQNLIKEKNKLKLNHAEKILEMKT